MNAGTVITLNEAKQYTQNFQVLLPGETKAYYVGANKVKQILEQENCIGVRMYNGYDTVQQVKNLVLVGVDNTGKDMTAGVIVEKLLPCPANCDISSALYF